LIGKTATKTGLEIKAALDENFYEKGIYKGVKTMCFFAYKFNKLVHT